VSEPGDLILIASLIAVFCAGQPLCHAQARRQRRPRGVWLGTPRLPWPMTLPPRHYPRSKIDARVRPSGRPALQVYLRLDPPGWSATSTRPTRHWLRSWVAYAHCCNHAHVCLKLVRRPACRIHPGPSLRTFKIARLGGKGDSGCCGGRDVITLR